MEGNGSYSKSASGSMLSRAPGVGSRTPISFGSILGEIMRKFLPDYENIFKESTDDYFIYVYRKWLGKGWWGFVMMQSARRRGFFNAEVGISNRKTYPYSLASWKPELAVDAVRERIGLLSYSEDKGWTYRSERELEVSLEEVIRNHVGGGVNTLMENSREKLEVEYNRCRKMVSDCRRALKRYEGKTPEEIFPEITGIKKIAEYVGEHARLESYERMQDPFIKAKLQEKEFMMLQCYLMGDIMDRPETRTNALSGELSLSYTDDQIAKILQRAPQQMYMAPLDTDEEYILRYAYLKSLMGLESVLCREQTEKSETGERSSG
ncbi:MAG: hypothetical protein LWY06_01240 [Firmicutes bacterium]|nr:hypothetical protein [Bacillota bacterium]